MDIYANRAIFCIEILIKLVITTAGSPREAPETLNLISYFLYASFGLHLPDIKIIDFFMLIPRITRYGLSDIWPASCTSYLNPAQDIKYIFCIICRFMRLCFYWIILLIYDIILSRRLVSKDFIFIICLSGFSYYIYYVLLQEL